MKLSTKLTVLVGAALVGVLLLAGVALKTLRDALIERRRAEIVMLLTKAEHLVDAYRGLQARGTLTREQAQQQAKEALSWLNADTKSYYWVTTADGINLVHPNPVFIGMKAKGNSTTDGRTDSQAYRDGLAQSHVALLKRHHAGIKCLQILLFLLEVFRIDDRTQVFPTKLGLLLI